jgi:hypothetical protein
MSNFLVVPKFSAACFPCIFSRFISCFLLSINHLRFCSLIEQLVFRALPSGLALGIATHVVRFRCSCSAVKAAETPRRASYF